MRKRWDGKAWKEAVSVIKSPKELESERSRAFTILRDLVYGFYGTIHRQYGALLYSEGEAVCEWMDYRLYRCALKFDLTYDNFFGYFSNSVRRAIADVLRSKCRRHIKLVSIDECPEGQTISEGVVQHDKVAELRNNLNAMQKRILDLLLKGHHKKDISKMLMLRRWDVNKVLRQIQKKAKSILEV